MTEPMTHTPNDAISYIVQLVRSRIEWGTDQIGGNTPEDGDTAAHLYDRNEYVLDDLGDLIKDVAHIAAPHATATTYSDGRPIRSSITLPDGTVFSHLWHPDPAQETERRVHFPIRNGDATVTITPPSGLSASTTRTLTAVADPEETNQ